MPGGTKGESARVDDSQPRDASDSGVRVDDGAGIGRWAHCAWSGKRLVQLGTLGCERRIRLRPSGGGGKRWRMCEKVLAAADDRDRDRDHDERRRCWKLRPPPTQKKKGKGREREGEGEGTNNTYSSK